MVPVRSYKRIGSKSITDSFVDVEELLRLKVSSPGPKVPRSSRVRRRQTKNKGGLSGPKP